MEVSGAGTLPDAFGATLHLLRQDRVIALALGGPTPVRSQCAQAPLRYVIREWRTGQARPAPVGVEVGVWPIVAAGEVVAQALVERRP